MLINNTYIYIHELDKVEADLTLDIRYDYNNNYNNNISFDLV